MPSTQNDNKELLALFRSFEAMERTSKDVVFNYLSSPDPDPNLELNAFLMQSAIDIMLIFKPSKPSDSDKKSSEAKLSDFVEANSKALLSNIKTADDLKTLFAITMQAGVKRNDLLLSKHSKLESLTNVISLCYELAKRGLLENVVQTINDDNIAFFDDIFTYVLTGERVRKKTARSIINHIKLAQSVNLSVKNREKILFFASQYLPEEQFLDEMAQECFFEIDSIKDVIEFLKLLDAPRRKKLVGSHRQDLYKLIKKENSDITKHFRSVTELRPFLQKEDFIFICYATLRDLNVSLMRDHDRSEQLNDLADALGNFKLPLDTPDEILNILKQLVSSIKDFQVFLYISSIYLKEKIIPYYLSQHSGYSILSKYVNNADDLVVACNALPPEHAMRFTQDSMERIVNLIENPDDLKKMHDKLPPVLAAYLVQKRMQFNTATVQSIDDFLKTYRTLSSEDAAQFTQEKKSLVLKLIEDSNDFVKVFSALNAVSRDILFSYEGLLNSPEYFEFAQSFTCILDHFGEEKCLALAKKFINTPSLFAAALCHFAKGRSGYIAEISKSLLETLKPKLLDIIPDLSQLVCVISKIKGYPVAKQRFEDKTTLVSTLITELNQLGFFTQVVSNKTELSIIKNYLVVCSGFSYPSDIEVSFHSLLDQITQNEEYLKKLKPDFSFFKECFEGLDTDHSKVVFYLQNKDIIFESVTSLGKLTYLALEVVNNITAPGLMVELAQRFPQYVTRPEHIEFLENYLIIRKTEAMKKLISHRSRACGGVMVNDFPHVHIWKKLIQACIKKSEADPASEVFSYEVFVTLISNAGSFSRLPRLNCDESEGYEEYDGVEEMINSEFFDLSVRGPNNEPPVFHVIDALKNREAYDLPNHKSHPHYVCALRHLAAILHKAGFEGSTTSLKEFTEIIYDECTYLPYSINVIFDIENSLKKRSLSFNNRIPGLQEYGNHYQKIIVLSVLFDKLTSLKKIERRKGEFYIDWEPLFSGKEPLKIDAGFLKALHTMGCLDVVNENSRYKTILTIAIENNDTTLARDLIEVGVDCNKLEQHGKQTPLITAIKHGNLKVINLIVEQAVNRNSKRQRDRFFSSSEIFALTSVSITVGEMLSINKDVRAILEGVGHFLSTEDTVIDHFSPLHYAALLGRMDIVALLEKSFSAESTNCVIPLSSLKSMCSAQHSVEVESSC